MTSMAMRWRSALTLAGMLLWIVGCRDGDITAPRRISGERSSLLVGVQAARPQVSAGSSHTCALRDDGTVVCWGANFWGESTAPPSLSSVTQVSSGGYHTCALEVSGTVVCWGRNDESQSTVPAGLSSVTQVSAGGRHTCALKADGAVVCWGRSFEGQLNVPPGLSSIAQLSAGGFHNCALKTDGSVVCWGWTDHGVTIVPLGLPPVTQVSAGAAHTCALEVDGTVACWGDNTTGPGQSNVPADLSSVVQVSAGPLHSCAVKAPAGTVVCWGRNAEDQLNVPPGLSSVTEVTTGEVHSCALQSGGTVVCWGSNTPGAGQLNVPSGLNLIARLPVSISIAPFSRPSPKPLLYNQTTPLLSEPVVVALLGTATFDAAQVVPTAVTLGNGTAAGIAVARLNGVPLSRVVDVNADGRPDRVFVFSTSALVTAGYLSTTTAAAQTLVLLGEHPDGRRFRGQDDVAVVVITPRS